MESASHTADHHPQFTIEIIGSTVKITRRQLRRIIREEKSKLLKEYGAMDKEVMNPTVAFAQAWSGLGDAIQGQMIDLINAHVEARLEDAVNEINPNAFNLAAERLTIPLRMMDGEDAEELKDMMEQVQTIIEEMT